MLRLFLFMESRYVMSDFEEYLEKYCREYGLTPEEAKEHKLVQEVKAYYEERDRDSVYDQK